MIRGFQTRWTPQAANVQAEARRVRVLSAQKAAQAEIATSGLEQGGAGGGSFASKKTYYYGEIVPP